MTTNIPDEVRGFLDYKVVERGISELTQQSYRGVLRDFFALLGHKKGVAQADIERYISSCFARELSARTVAHHLAVLREFFKFLQRDGLIRRDPMLRIESPKMWKRLPGYMSEIDVSQFIDAPEPSRSSYYRPTLSLRQAWSLRDRAIVETLYASAIRVSELISAKLVDLNVESGVLIVFGKGSKERMTPLGRPAIDALRAYLNLARPLLQPISPYLFVGLKRPRLTRQAVCKLLSERAKRAGLSHVYPHKLRHSGATHMLDHGANLRVIQEILGHADISTTEIYTHVSAKHVSDVFRECHPRNHPRHAQMGLFQSPTPILTAGPVTCTECNALAAEGRRLCELHQLRNNAASARSQKRRYDRNKAEGICVDCDQPAIEGQSPV